MLVDTMNGAGSQAYSYDTNLTGRHELSRQTSKKRRLTDRSTEQDPGQLNAWHQTQPPQFAAPMIHGSSLQKHNSAGQPLSFTSTADAVSVPAAGLSVPGPVQPWTQPNSFAVHTGDAYSDVASAYSQPYYHDHVDQTSYASSWPPAGHGQPGPYEVSGPLYSQPQMDSITYAFPAASGFAPMPIHEPSDALPVRPGSVSSPIALSGAAYGSTLGNEPAQVQILAHNLPTLDDQAVQIIHMATKHNYAQLRGFIQDDMSDAARAFRNLRFNFEQTRHLFFGGNSRNPPFITSLPSPNLENIHQDTLRRANIATFILAVLDTSTTSLHLLHEYFIPTFVPYHQTLPKWQGSLLLELKTQGYIAAVQTAQADHLLEQFFPSFGDGAFVARHPETPTVFPTEREFLDNCQARRHYLVSDLHNASHAQLAQKYPWTDFVREFLSSIAANVNDLLSPLSRGQRGGQPASLLRRPGSGNNSSPLPVPITMHSPVVAADAMDGMYRNTGPQSAGSGGEARKMTSAGATVRQPWTKPEEEALLEGLERVNGPHWSQILALYGRGGSINEVLKDRNQVQLKDKARNLKLWHLKMGKEVPANLKGVTGELRKRGGARARAALEAEEKNARLERGVGDGADSDGIDPTLNAAGVLTSQTSRI